MIILIVCIGFCMLFYEPLFLFVFFPTLYLLYIAVGGRARTRFAVLLVASLFFYLWSEPLFVPIVLISCVLDYALGRGIASGTNARALLTLGQGHSVLITGFQERAADRS